MKKSLQLSAFAMAAFFATGYSQNTKQIGQTQDMQAQQAEQVFQINHRSCGTPPPDPEWDAAFNKKVEEFVANMQANKAQMIPYTIPVIVHVIHTGQGVGTFPNLAQGQINSQLTVLNQDFASNGLNVGNLPAVFAPAKANTDITFCFAQKNPTGGVLAEPGIDRINANNITAALTGTFTSKDPKNAVYNNLSKFKDFVDNYIKPNTIWDPTRYMNIWITDEQSAVGLLGYATFPIGTGLTGITGNGTATTDGLWCWSAAFGSNSIFPGGTYTSTYNKGRTAVHEIGHWVGLRHTWGDGTCATDYCNDTPPAQTSNFGCPTHPYKLGTCSGNTTGEMFQNFMDYTDDACMYIFTNDQKTRIQTAMANGTYRSQLSASASTLCTISASAPVASISIPATGCTGTAVATTNNSTGNPIPTYVWSTSPSAGVTYNPNNTATNPSITFANPGTYTVTCSATNSVGTNGNSKVITVNSCTSACNDTLGTIFSGGNGANGNLFDLTNSSSNPIQLISVDQCFFSPGTLTMEIYTKVGTYVGSETNSAAWTLVGSAPVTAATASVPVAVPISLNGVTIPAGGTLGMYITVTTGNNLYTNGNNQGGVYKSKMGLEFREGKGNSYPFGGTFGTAPASRIWNGVLHFCNLTTGIESTLGNLTESTIFPNPNSGTMNVSIASTTTLQNATAKVYDMFGRVVYIQSNINDNNFTVNHNLSSGIYVLQVDNDNKIILNKKISVN